MFDIFGRLSQLARERGMSVRQLSQLAGLHQTTLYSAKYKESELKVSTVERVCDVLGVSLAEFFDDDGEYRRRIWLQGPEDEDD